MIYLATAGFCVGQIAKIWEWPEPMGLIGCFIVGAMIGYAEWKDGQSGGK